MNWQTTYPTLEAVQLANLDTVSTWCDKLPPPQTDVERTIKRRLKARRDLLAGEELRRLRPDIADTLNNLADTLHKTTGVRPFPKY